MPMIPMKQTVTRVRITGNEWDGDLDVKRVDLKCRVSEGTKLVRSMSGTNGAQGVESAEVVSSAQFYFDKLADVKLTDKFEYTNELDETRTYSPLTIEIKRNIGGKPVLTVVSV